jgi:hypothetical protein
LNNPLRYTDPSGQYEEDVHYDLTKVLAYAVGFSLDDATRIATETQGPDNDGDERSAYASEYARALYHFTTEERRQEMLGEFEGKFERLDFDNFGSPIKLYVILPVALLIAWQVFIWVKIVRGLLPRRLEVPGLRRL